MTDPDPFAARDSLSSGQALYRLDRIVDPQTLPYTVCVLLENLLRRADSEHVTEHDVRALAAWPERSPDARFAFMPARVIMQDLTGVPAVVDLAAMRDAVARRGGDPGRVDPLVPVDLVIDHSVQVDAFGSAIAYQRNIEREFERNTERYALLRWAQGAFRNFRVVPPGMGIVHQVNLEYLAAGRPGARRRRLPDTLVGTDSHTTMINALGVLGWGVGGIEAEAVMLGQPLYLTAPVLLGVRLDGALRPGVTATDLVLTITELLRPRGVVGQFVEFYGAGVGGLTVADRATISNMSPEFGSTAAVFPVDDETLGYLRETGRPAELIELVERYTKEQGLFRTGQEEPGVLGHDRLRSGDPSSRASPARAGRRTGSRWRRSGELLGGLRLRVRERHPPGRRLGRDRRHHQLHQHLQPGADAGRRTGRQEGRRARPGDPAVGEDQPRARLARGQRLPRPRGADGPWNSVRFNLVGFGCTTCIGNSGPLPEDVAGEIDRADLSVAAVLSGNRNFEARIHPAGARQLPGVAAAGGRLCPGGHGQQGPRPPSRWARAPTARCTCATSGRRPTRSRR